MIDYEILRVMWWGIVGVLMIGFAVTDGFDFGVASLLPFVARNNDERRVAINSIGPVWDGNQIWFVLFGGAIFAAFPMIYSAAFSLFYIPFFLLLFCFIIRPIAIEFRSKMTLGWASFWDWILFFSATLGSILFGVAVGNSMLGLKFDFDEFGILINQTSFISMLNPFSILCGIISYVMIVSYGAAFLNLKTDDSIKNRANMILTYTPFVLLVLVSIAGYFAYNLDGFMIVSNGKSNALTVAPGYHDVLFVKHGLFENYKKYPWFIIAPIGFYVTLALVVIFRACKRDVLTMISHAFMFMFTCCLFGFSTFPFLLPSTLNLNASLTIFNASSSQAALFIMFLIVGVFLPIVLSYVSYVYYSFRGVVTLNSIKNNNKTLY